MNSYDDEATSNNVIRARESEESRTIRLNAKMAELMKTKDELKMAKDNATQSWLDSRPLIDELERLKADLLSAQNRTSMLDSAISDLESQLETIIMDIRSKRDEELKASRMINETTRVVDQTREELEQHKADKGEEQRARTKLKQTMRLRRQNLRTLQLKLRAVRVESEACKASAAEALPYIECSEANGDTPVELTQEEYYALKRRAKEETSLAEWRISVSVEQKNAAEAERDFALTRLKGMNSDNRPRMEKTEKKMFEDEETNPELEEPDPITRGTARVNNRGLAFPKARAKEIAKSKPSTPGRMGKLKSRKNKVQTKVKKASFLQKIKGRIVQMISRLIRSS